MTRLFPGTFSNDDLISSDQVVLELYVVDTGNSIPYQWKTTKDDLEKEYQKAINEFYGFDLEESP